MASLSEAITGLTGQVEELSVKVEELGSTVVSEAGQIIALLNKPNPEVAAAIAQLTALSQTVTSASAEIGSITTAISSFAPEIEPEPEPLPEPVPEEPEAVGTTDEF